MSAESTIDDQSEREDLYNQALHHLIHDAPNKVDENDLCKLTSELSGHIWNYIHIGHLVIHERCTEMVDNNEQPFKATLEFVIDSNPDPDTTVCSYLVATLV